MRNKSWVYFLALMGIVLVGMFILKTYTNLFSAVVFEDYANYDDRVNKPYFVESWYSGYPEHPRGIVGNWTPIGCTTSSSNTCLPDLIDDKWFFHLGRTGAETDLLISPLLSEGDYTYILDGIVTKCGTPGGTYPCSGGAEATTTKNLMGNDIKTTIFCRANNANSYHCTFSIGKLVGTNFVLYKEYDVSPSCALGPPRCDAPKTTTFEFFASKLNRGLYDVYINGAFQESLTLTENTLNLRYSAFGSTMEITSLGYKIPFSCQQGPDEVLGEQTFVGGRTLSIYDTRYPVTKFCLAHPALITSNSGGGSTTTAEIYQKLSKGEVLNIPADQTWTLYYLFYNDGTIPGTDCGTDSSYNVNTSNCVKLVKFCDAGQVWDRTLGTCVAGTSSNLSGKCGNFARYDVVEGECIFEYPNQGICEAPGSNYNSGTVKCEYPYDGIQCFPRYILNTANNRCEADPLAFILCSTNLSFNPVTGYCQNADGSVVEPVVSEITSICNKLAGTFRYNSAGNPVCVFNPVGLQKVIEKEWVIKTKTDTVTIYTETPVYKTDWKMIIIGGIALVIITFLLVKIFTKRR